MGSAPVSARHFAFAVLLIPALCLAEDELSIAPHPKQLSNFSRQFTAKSDGLGVTGSAPMAMERICFNRSKTGRICFISINARQIMKCHLGMEPPA